MSTISSPMPDRTAVRSSFVGGGQHVQCGVRDGEKARRRSTHDYGGSAYPANLDGFTFREGNLLVCSCGFFLSFQNICTGGAAAGLFALRNSYICPVYPPLNDTNAACGANYIY